MENISRDIIAKAAGGDIEAFEDIYRKTSTFVYNVALRITNNTEDDVAVINGLRDVNNILMDRMYGDS